MPLLEPAWTNEILLSPSTYTPGWRNNYFTSPYPIEYSPTLTLPSRPSGKIFEGHFYVQTTWELEIPPIGVTFYTTDSVQFYGNLSAYQDNLGHSFYPVNWNRSWGGISREKIDFDPRVGLYATYSYSNWFDNYNRGGLNYDLDDLIWCIPSVMVQYYANAQVSIPTGYHNTARVRQTVTKLSFRYRLVNGACESGPGGDDDGGGGDNSDDGSDYGAIKCDSPREWLHYGDGAYIRTRHTVPGISAFSGSHSVEKWKHFCAAGRDQGALYCLGRSGGASKVFVSFDGGQTATEKKSVNCYSSAMEYDSERRLLMFFIEDTPAGIATNPDANGAVSLYVSRDSGVTWDASVAVQYNGANLSARLLGATYERRNGGEMFLRVKIAGDAKILSSNDVGRTFELRLS